MTRELCKLAIEKFERVRKIGELDVRLPEPPRWNEIDGYNLPKEKQKFTYQYRPKDDEITEEFLTEEYNKIINGYWFYNNGNLEYITGAHYFTLNYWKDKGKQLLFVDAQRDVFLWWASIEQNSNLTGGNLITNRRFGKTLMATAIGYYRTSTVSDRRCGIQSKTNKDGEGVFKKLIDSWIRLPDWLKPIDTGVTRPKTILEFYPASEKSTKKLKKVYADALFSSIDFRASVEEAYDGEELHTHIDDEVGKTIEINTDTRYGIIKFCLMKGPSIIGKILRTTTVEDMDKKGGKNMKKTWDESRMNTLNPNTGRTTTHLTNLLITADYGFLGNHPVTGEPFVDEYGYSNRELARQYILSTWENLEGADLASAQQKNPLSEKHVWQAKNFGGCFDNELLQTQLDYLERTNDREEENAPRNLIRKVTFYRDDEGVKWRDDPNGNCEMVWDFPDPSLARKNKINSLGVLTPDNDASFAIGVDPVGATITTGSEKSQAVAYVYRKGDINDPENSALMVLRYAPPRRSIRFKADFHRYVMMLCEYYGCKANYESNIDDYYEKFIEEGYKNFVMWRPKSTIDPQRKNVKIKYGTPSNDPFALQKQTDIADEYIKMRYHKIYFVELVRQLIAFDPADRTHYDDCIAFFMALIAGTDRKANATVNTTGLSILPVFKKVS